MFNTREVWSRQGIRRFAEGLAILSFISLFVTAWIMIDVRREQDLVAKIIRDLPPNDLVIAEELSGDLRWHRALAILLALNVVGSAVAFAMVVWGYLTSEQSLRDVKVLSTDVLSSMDVGVLTTNREGQLTSINRYGESLLRPADECLGERLGDVGSEHAVLDEICMEVIANEQPIRDRDYIVMNNGHSRTLRASCTSLRKEDGKEVGTVLQIRDVTERVLMVERLRRMERYMGLGSLAAGLQHEIKNPLSALTLHIQLLCERVDRDFSDPEVAELLDIVHTEIQRINEVLDGFRNYASAGPLRRAAVDMALLVERVVRFLRPQAENHNVKLKVTTPPELLGLIQADSVQIEQVLLNLALNAIAAMTDGGMLTLGLSRQGDFVRIDVTDTGNGILPENQAKVFDPYFTTRSEGTGMGLAICDKIIRQHNGSIDFVTGPEGTEFTLLLPSGTQS